MTAQMITESTANKLIDKMESLTVAIAVSNERLEVQNRWNQEQQKLNTFVSEKLAKMAESNVTRDERLKALEGWKNWLNGVLTAILIAELITVAVAVFTLTHGGAPP